MSSIEMTPAPKVIATEKPHAAQGDSPPLEVPGRGRTCGRDRHSPLSDFVELVLSQACLHPRTQQLCSKEHLPARG